MRNIKTVDSSCRGCMYLTTVSCTETKNRACDYIGATDQRRPCPAGKGCTVRKTGERYDWVRRRWIHTTEGEGIV